MKPMRILLIGEYSNLHHTLSQGLKKLGHQVTLVSDGDGWKNYPRDVDLTRKGYSAIHTLGYVFRILRLLPSFRGYDIVQIINPLFLNLKAKQNLRIFRYLKKHNKRVFLGAFGVDHYWVKACLDKKTFRYSDFYYGTQEIPNPSNPQIIHKWMHSKRQNVNEEIASNCDGIIACLYEYYAAYRPHFEKKVTYIPLPIDTEAIPARPLREVPEKVRIFIGIQKIRSVSKGTDVILEVLQKLKADHPETCEIVKAESVPYAEYVRLMADSHILIDQLYSYTPAMNALQAMAQGLVAGSGAEPEMYRLYDEETLRPIINLCPDRRVLYDQLRETLLNKEKLPELSAQSITFVKKHHDHIKVAEKYLETWRVALLTGSNDKNKPDY